MPGPIQSIERAAAVLELIGTGPRPLRLADVSAALRLPKGTAHGILRTLTQVGFVEQDRATGRYQIGAGLLDLGSGRVDTNEVRARSMNWADPLAARTGAAVRIGMLAEADILVVHYVFRPDDSLQESDVGALLPAHATALGKVLLAHHPGARPQLPEPLPALTSKTLTNRTRLERELTRTRERGYGVEYGEHSVGQAGIAAPIVGHGGLVVAAVAVHGPIDQLCETTGGARPKVLGLVVDCARAITRELETARVMR